jgi:hypothetical protein
VECPEGELALSGGYFLSSFSGDRPDFNVEYIYAFLDSNGTPRGFLVGVFNRGGNQFAMRANALCVPE